MTATELDKSGPEKTRELLLQSAQELFSRQGYDGTTIKDIVDRAGVNVSLVSYHFKGKEGLYRACLEQFGREKLAAAERVLQSPKSLEEVRVRLSMFVDELFETYVSQPDSVCMIHRETEMQSPLIEDVFKETFFKIFMTLADFFKSAQKAKLFKKSSDPLILARIFFGSITHLTRTDRVNEKFFSESLKQPAYRRRVSEHLIDLFLNGACVQE